MEDFVVRQTAPTGSEKAAILLGELGVNGSKYMMQYFSKAELRKINKALKKMGSSYNVRKENMVLEETMRYGIFHRITDCTMEQFADSNYKNEKSAEAQKLLQNNPEALASVLRSWLQG